MSMARTIGAVLLLVMGLYLVYSGYEMKRSLAAKAERQVSAVREYFTGDDRDAGKVNRQATFKLVAGGVVAVFGLVFIVKGRRRRRDGDDGAPGAPRGPNDR